MPIANESAETRLELLRMAVQLVTNEYIDKRAQDHNAWVAKSDLAWKARREKIPYPSFPPYPNEGDIVARANVLCEFLHKEPPDTTKPATPISPLAAMQEDIGLESFPPATVVSTPDSMPEYKPEQEPVPSPIPKVEPIAQPVATPAPVAPPEVILEEPVINQVAKPPELVPELTPEIVPQAPVVDVKAAIKEIENIFSAPPAIAPPEVDPVKKDYPEIIYPAMPDKSIVDEAIAGKNVDSTLPLFANWRAAWRKPLSQ